MFQENAFIALSIDDQWGVDLIDMSKYSKENDGIAFVLVVIDMFSPKFICMQPLQVRKANLQLLKMFCEKVVVLPIFVQIKASGFDSKLFEEKKTSITCTSIIPKSKSIMPASDKNNEVLTIWKHHIQTVVWLC